MTSQNYAYADDLALLYASREGCGGHSNPAVLNLFWLLTPCNHQKSFAAPG